MATQKRVIVWATPRSLSTALMRALSQLPDSLVFHEYLLLVGLNEVGRQLLDPSCPDDWKSDLSDMDAEQGFDITSWKQMYEQPYPGKAFILGKEISDTLGGRMEMIPNSYTHVFLTRHPRKAVPSHYKALSIFPEDVRWSMIQNNNFKATASIYDYVTTTLGQPAPLVFDGDDLRAKPTKALRHLCQVTGMPFSQNLLYWDQIVDELAPNWLMPKFIWSNKDFSGNKSAFETTCFHSDEGSTPAASEEHGDAIKPEHEQIIQAGLPYHNYLYECRVILSD